MSAKPGSRWANIKDDEELEAKLKKEKEEKRRRKAEKARKLEEDKQKAAALAAQQQQHRDTEENADDNRPTKRRKLTPDPSSSLSTAKQDDAPAKLLRFHAGGWAKSRSVENYDKLNDIEEGTYGWVARATDRATGKIVALKRLKLDAGDRGGLPVTGLREIQLLKDCKHRNIVTMQEVVVGDNVTRLDKYGCPLATATPIPGFYDTDSSIALYSWYSNS